jgi:hypothetical protein
MTRLLNRLHVLVFAAIVSSLALVAARSAPGTDGQSHAAQEARSARPSSATRDLARRFLSDGKPGEALSLARRLMDPSNPAEDLEEAAAVLTLVANARPASGEAGDALRGLAE